MKKITNWLMMGLLVLTAMSCQQQPEGKQLFNMNQIAKRVSGKASQMTNSEVFNSKVLKIDPKEGNDGVVIRQKATSLFGRMPTTWYSKYLTKPTIVASST